MHKNYYIKISGVVTDILSLYICIIDRFYEHLLITFLLIFVSDIDTDELDSDAKNVEEEIVEFFIKEEIIVVE